MKCPFPRCLPVLCALLAVLFLNGCASFSTTLRPIDVRAATEPVIPLRVGIRGVRVEDVRSGMTLLASQPAVKKALENDEQLASDLTKAFTDFCKESNLFTECVGEPFDASQVDLELQPTLRRLNYSDTYGEWEVANFITFDIPGLLGWPYENNADCEFSVEARSRNGAVSKIYTGVGDGQKNTNLYALLFGLREVPHAMEALNRSITGAFDGISQQMVVDKAYLLRSREAEEPE